MLHLGKALDPKGQLKTPPQFKREEIATSVFSFQAHLKSNPWSPFFALKNNTIGSKWQIELKTDFSDDEGNRYLSVWMHVCPFQHPSHFSPCEMLVIMKIELLFPPKPFDFMQETAVINEAGIHRIPVLSNGNETWTFKLDRFTPLYEVLNQDLECLDPVLYFRITIAELSKGKIDKPDVFHYSFNKTECTQQNSSPTTPAQTKENAILSTGNSIDEDERNINTDAFIRLGTRLFPVVTASLSAHSQVFRRYFESNDFVSIPMDVTNHFSSIAIFKVIQRFCMTGKLIAPKRLQGVINILKTAKSLEMTELHEMIQNHLLSNFLDADNFVSLTWLLISNDLGDNAQPILLDFLLENYENLVKNPKFCECFEHIKSFCGKCLLEPADEKRGMNMGMGIIDIMEVDSIRGE